MATISAVCEKGVFRPTEPIDLPEGSHVQIDIGPANVSLATGKRKAEQEAHLDRVYQILSRRYDGGASDVAARHDEHQP
jgi:predicted DNA-binding antitoxin AbrB/MazE fold protein